MHTQPRHSKRYPLANVRKTFSTLSASRRSRGTRLSQDDNPPIDNTPRTRASNRENRRRDGCVSADFSRRARDDIAILYSRSRFILRRCGASEFSIKFSSSSLARARSQLDHCVQGFPNSGERTREVERACCPQRRKISSLADLRYINSTKRVFPRTSTFNSSYDDNVPLIVRGDTRETMILNATQPEDLLSSITRSHRNFDTRQTLSAIKIHYSRLHERRLPISDFSTRLSAPAIVQLNNRTIAEGKL